MQTLIERSWTRTIAWSGVGLTLGGAGIWLSWWAATGEGFRFLAWLPAIVLLIAAVPCFLAARSLTGHAACPHCGESLLADSTQVLRAIHCPQCREYARVVRGRIEKLPDDWVDAEPRFTAKIPKDAIHWPGCAMCGAPPTRARVHDHLVPHTALNLAIAAVALPTVGVMRVGGGTVHQLSVPYCDAHDDCVELDWESGGLVIRFRSLAVFNAFSAANRDGAAESSSARG